MYQNNKRPVDPAQPYRPVYVGTFEKWITVGEKKRRYLAYVPEGARESTAGVLVLGENGRTADDLLEESAWRDIADTEECKEKLIIIYLEPENGTWNVNEPYGMKDGDVAYVNAVQLSAAERFLFCIHESKFYLYGMREGGTAAHMAAMFNPAVYAGVASIGGSAVKEAYLNECSKALCTNLDGYIDEAARQGRVKQDIPMPAWVINDPEIENGQQSALEYWKRTCGVDERKYACDPDTVEWRRETDTEYPLSQEIQAYRVRESTISGASAAEGAKLSRRIWKDFLYRQRRWMGDPGGDLRVTRDPTRDLDMEYHYEQIGGWMREWYVYVPEAVKAQPDVAAAVVVAMHGYTCSGEIYAGNSEWSKVADQYGFIVIHPTAVPGNIRMDNQACSPDFVPLPAWNFLDTTPNGPDDVAFITTIIQRTAAEHIIDPRRIFATGHSHGSMMAQTLALAVPELFAAVAPCSGVLFGGIGEPLLKKLQIEKRTDVEMPIWMFVGEQEPWLLPHLPAGENDTAKTIILWRKLNHVESATEPNWGEGWSIHKERWHDLSYYSADRPMVRYTWVDYMPHATMTEMSFRIWEEFFTHYQRETDGTVTFLK